MTSIIGDFPTAYFFFETILAAILLGIPAYIFAKIRAKKQIPIAKIVFTTVVWLCVAYGTFLEPQKIAIHTFKITSSTLPRLKIAVISDLHAGPYKKSDFFARLVQKINKIPDLDAVFIPGDFIFGNATRFSGELSPLRNLRVPKKWATLGNHDHDISEPRNSIQSTAVSRALENFGIRELKNSADFWEKKGIWVLGVDDNYLGYHDLNKTFAQLPPESSKILIAHSPDIIDDFGEKFQPNLVISGHTHCGQIRFPIIGALDFVIPAKNKIPHISRLEKTQIFNTCGAGESGIRARFLNPPEIAILEISPLDSVAENF